MIEVNGVEKIFCGGQEQYSDLKENAARLASARGGTNHKQSWLAERERVKLYFDMMELLTSAIAKCLQHQLVWTLPRSLNNLPFEAYVPSDQKYVKENKRCCYSIF